MALRWKIAIITEGIHTVPAVLYYAQFWRGVCVRVCARVCVKVCVCLCACDIWSEEDETRVKMIS